MIEELQNLMARAIAEAVPLGERWVVAARLGLGEDGRGRSILALQEELGFGFAEISARERQAVERIRIVGEGGARGPATELIQALQGAVGTGPERIARAAQLALGLPNVPRRRAATTLLYLSGSSWDEARRERAEWIDPEQAAFERLLSEAVIWPRQSQWVFPEVERRLPRKAPARSASGARSFSSHKMESEVGCDSELEYRFYERLDSLREILMFWEQPLKVDLPRGRLWPYHPDAFVVYRDGRCFVAEVKPAGKMALFKTIEKFNALAEHCEREGFGSFLGNARETVQDLLRADPGIELRKAVLTRVAAGPIDLSEWNVIHSRLRAPIIGLRSIVLHEHLWFDDEPFLLRRPTTYERSQLEAFTQRLVEPAVPFPAPSDVPESVLEQGDVRERKRQTGYG